MAKRRPRIVVKIADMEALDPDGSEHLNWMLLDDARRIRGIAIEIEHDLSKGRLPTPEELRRYVEFMSSIASHMDQMGRDAVRISHCHREVPTDEDVLHQRRARALKRAKAR